MICSAEDQRPRASGQQGVSISEEQEVARLHLENETDHAEQKKQADYLGVAVEGPYKADHYRY